MLTAADGLRFRQRAGGAARRWHPMGRFASEKTADRNTNGGPNPVATEISQAPVGWSQVKSQAWKMHVDFSHPWIVALERELIGINKNELTLDRILARNRSRVRERVFLA
jgi:hypothetical protein